MVKHETFWEAHVGIVDPSYLVNKGDAFHNKAFRIWKGSLKVVEVLLVHVSNYKDWFNENGNRIGSPKVSHDVVLSHVNSWLFVVLWGNTNSDTRMNKEIKYGKVAILI